MFTVLFWTLKYVPKNFAKCGSFPAENCIAVPHYKLLFHVRVADKIETIICAIKWGHTHDTQNRFAISLTQDSSAVLWTTSFDYIFSISSESSVRQSHRINIYIYSMAELIVCSVQQWKFFLWMSHKYRDYNK